MSQRIVVTKARIEWIDILKGLGILMVILGHHLQLNKYLANMIWSVHMPLFFIIAGVTFKSKEPKKALKHNINNLLIPYVWGGVLLCLADIISRGINGELNGIGDIFLNYIGKILYGAGGYSLHSQILNYDFLPIGGYWFFVALFISKTLYNALSVLDERHKGILVFALSYTGYCSTTFLSQTYGLWLPWSFQTGLTALLFLYVGDKYIKNYIIEADKTQRCVVFGSCMMIWALIIYSCPGIYMVNNEYPNGAIGLLGGIVGTIVLIYVSMRINNSILKKILMWFGQHTDKLLIFHIIELNFIPWSEILFRYFEYKEGTLTTVIIFMFKVFWGVICVIVAEQIVKIYGRLKGKC